MLFSFVRVFFFNFVCCFFRSLSLPPACAPMLEFLAFTVVYHCRYSTFNSFGVVFGPKAFFHSSSDAMSTTLQPNRTKTKEKKLTFFHN